MKAPRSYTREDIAEVHVHGGRVSAARALDRIIALGARPAEPGEFTKRAFLNGRIDLARAEAVMSMVSAASEAAATAAARQLSGGASSFAGGCRNHIVDLIALIEASVDFPEEIEEADVQGRVIDKAREISMDISRRADPEAARAVREGIRAVIIGKSNVGKSSLMNALLNRDCAIVTDVPGTTRDVLTERLSAGGLIIELSDTAGQRDSRDPVEQIGIERARAAQRDGDSVILVADNAAPPCAEDWALMGRADDRYIIAFNKCDIYGSFEPRRDMPGGFKSVCLSALTGEGVDELIGAMLERAARLDLREDMLVQARHVSCALDAKTALDAAVRALESGAPADIAAADLWEAARALGRITGEDAGEDVIEAIFKSFCVGK
jgi:tRNA modification GTPase